MWDNQVVSFQLLQKLMKLIICSVQIQKSIMAVAKILKLRHQNFTN